MQPEHVSPVVHIPRWDPDLRFETVSVNTFRLVRAGIISPSDIMHMTLDDVDLWHLYLDAVEEAAIVRDDPRR